MTDTPNLEDLSVDRPCPKKWAELVGDERRRYCSACDLHVTNLSAMTRDEGEAFLAGSSGRVCVTYLPDAEGKVTSSVPVRRDRTGWRHVLARAASLLAGVAFLLTGCREAQPELLGEVALPPDTDAPEDEHPRLLGEACVAPENPIDHTDYVMGAVPAEPPPGADEEVRLLGRVALPVDGPAPDERNDEE